MIEDPFNPPITIRGKKENVPKHLEIFSTCPVIFETKRQYVNELIKNQEKVRNTNFTPREEAEFRKNELKKMEPVIARYTTKSNPFMPPQTVFFTDKKITPEMMKEEARHEFNHQAWEPFDSSGSKNMIKPCNKCGCKNVVNGWCQYCGNKQ